MRFKNLDDWLNWQETLNPKEIDLGLGRIVDVLARAGLSPRLDCPVITVAGTNGKGSVVAMIEAIAAASGMKVCSYTSPHFINYNERIRINLQPVDDQSLCMAFEYIDQARSDIPLTYFEFGTLAAAKIFRQQKPDLVVLEVGLGGRLDAVNSIDPDVSVITTIDIDHTDWLGGDRESIAREKAGIFRKAGQAVCGDACPPDSLYQIAEETGTGLFVLQRDYSIESEESGWTLNSPVKSHKALPFPALKGNFQLGNAATAIVALQLLGERAALQPGSIEAGLRQVGLRGRFETVHNRPLIQVDVAHNPQAATALAQQLENSKPDNGGRRYALLAMLEDKDIEQVVDSLAGQVDSWLLAGLPDISRGLSVEKLQKRVRPLLADAKIQTVGTVEQGCDKLLKQMTDTDRAIIFGSFYTVSAAIEYFSVHDDI